MTTNPTIDLAGLWQLSLEQPSIDTIDCFLPGSIQAQGIGNDVTVDTPWTADRNGNTQFDTDPKYEAYRQAGNVKFPYWLQPSKYFVGKAYFTRVVDVPDDWVDGRILLHLERAHWQTSVSVDGILLDGVQDSLSTPHEHDLTDFLPPGRHTIQVCVDNRVRHNVGPNAHSVSDHTQGNWNGVIGAIELRLQPRTHISLVKIGFSAASRQMDLAVTVTGGSPGDGLLRCRDVTVPVSWGPSSTSLLKIPTSSLPTWSEHSPQLISTEVALLDEAGNVIDSKRISHGLRTIAVAGRQFEVNGVPTQFRGTLECCIFPRTGYPPTDLDAWRRIMTIVKAHGLNHLRFHSWCPPEAAFAAADVEGVYLQVECATWPNQGATIGDATDFDSWLYAEAARIICTYGHHPSFVMFACGNEPAGEHHKPFLERWTQHWKTRDPQRLHTGGSGWPESDGSDFHVRFQPRIQHWGAELNSSINSRDLDTRLDYGNDMAAFEVPTVTHEIGQWCVYPDLSSNAKYDGAYRATSLEITQASLQNNRLEHLADEFLNASGTLQAIVYKEEIEAQLRTPNLGGFQLLDLHDFPGQGTALVGVLDAFWDAKGYITAEAFRRFCGPTVLLARMPKRVWNTSEDFTATVELSNFSGDSITPVVGQWKIESEDGTRAYASGELRSDISTVGKSTLLGQVSVKLKELPTATMLRFVAEVPGIAPTNNWNLWILDTASQECGVLVTNAIDEHFMQACQSGRPILFCPGRSAIASPVALGFSPIFWNTLFTNGQAPHTLGLLIDHHHTAFKLFPTSFHSDWQWQEPLRHAACLMLDRLAAARPETPLVRVIDDWNENRSLGLLLETRVGNSRVIISGIDLGGDLVDRPVSNQLKSSLCHYLANIASVGKVQALTQDDLMRLFPGPHNTVAADSNPSSSSTYGRL